VGAAAGVHGVRVDWGEWDDVNGGRHCEGTRASRSEVRATANPG
jgi:hypothetical protein